MLKFTVNTATMIHLSILGDIQNQEMGGGAVGNNFENDTFE